MRSLPFSYFFLLLFILVFFGCLSSTTTGILTGTVSIGPLCPVETNPPQPDCTPTLSTYEAHPITVFRLVSGSQAWVEVTAFTANANGSYQLDLAPGHYELRAVSGINGTVAEEAEVKSNETTTANISIDTGIR